MIKVIKAIIFDLNGIFIQSDYLSDRIEKEYNLSKDKFIPALKEIMGKARKPGVPDSFVLWKPYLKEWNLNLPKSQFFSFWFSGEHLVQNAVVYSQELRDYGLDVFIISNNFKERADYYQEHFPILFSTVTNIYFSQQTGFVKPEPQAFLQILTQIGKPE